MVHICNRRYERPDWFGELLQKSWEVEFPGAGKWTVGEKISEKSYPPNFVKDVVEAVGVFHCSRTEDGETHEAIMKVKMQ